MNWFLNLNPIHQYALVPCMALIATYAAIGIVEIIRYAVKVIKDFRNLERINNEFDPSWMYFDMWEETK